MIKGRTEAQRKEKRTCIECKKIFEQIDTIETKRGYFCLKCYLKNTNKKITKQQLDDLQWALDKLFDIAEKFYPLYYSSDIIAHCLDIYKSIFD